MPKIKVKKQMTLPELIEYIFEHDIKNKKFFGKTEEYARKNEIYVNEDGYIDFSLTRYTFDKHEIFTVEIEEEITEETAIPRLLEVRNLIPLKNMGWHYFKSLKPYLHVNHAISEVENRDSIAFYMLNDDMTMTLIWKDGVMVE